MRRSLTYQLVFGMFCAVSIISYLRFNSVAQPANVFRQNMTETVKPMLMCLDLVMGPVFDEKQAQIYRSALWSINRQADAI